MSYNFPVGIYFLCILVDKNVEESFQLKLNLNKFYVVFPYTALMPSCFLGTFFPHRFVNLGRFVRNNAKVSIAWLAHAK